MNINILNNFQGLKYTISHINQKLKGSSIQGITQNAITSIVNLETINVKDVNGNTLTVNAQVNEIYHGKTLIVKATNALQIIDNKNKIISLNPGTIIKTFQNNLVFDLYTGKGLFINGTNNTSKKQLFVNQIGETDKVVNIKTQSEIVYSCIMKKIKEQTTVKVTITYTFNEIYDSYGNAKQTNFKVISSIAPYDINQNLQTSKINEEIAEGEVTIQGLDENNNEEEINVFPEDINPIVIDLKTNQPKNGRLTLVRKSIKIDNDKGELQIQETNALKESNVLTTEDVVSTLKALTSRIINKKVSVSDGNINTNIIEMNINNKFFIKSVKHSYAKNDGKIIDLQNGSMKVIDTLTKKEKTITFDSNDLTSTNNDVIVISDTTNKLCETNDLISIKIKKEKVFKWQKGNYTIESKIISFGTINSDNIFVESSQSINNIVSNSKLGQTKHSSGDLLETINDNGTIYKVEVNKNGFFVNSNDKDNNIQKYENITILKKADGFFDITLTPINTNKSSASNSSLLNISGNVSAIQNSSSISSINTQQTLGSTTNNSSVISEITAMKQQIEEQNKKIDTLIANAQNNSDLNVQLNNMNQKMDELNKIVLSVTSLANKEKVDELSRRINTIQNTINMLKANLQTAQTAANTGMLNLQQDIDNIIKEIQELVQSTSIII